MPNDSTTPDKARAKLDALAACVKAAQTANNAKMKQPKALLNQSTNQAFARAGKGLTRGYSKSVRFLDTVEKSPVIRLAVALVFLLTAAAVLFDLNDRRTQIEIAAWDLFEKTKPGTPQRTRAVNLLAETGTNLSRVNFGVLRSDFTIPVDISSESFEISLAISEGGKPSPNYCVDINGTMLGGVFSPTAIWTVLPPSFQYKNMKLRSADFSCLEMIAEFTKAEMADSRFLLSTILEAKFDQSVLQEARFDYSKIWKADYLGADLTRASFNFATLGDPGNGIDKKVNFRAAKLQRSSFQNATLFSVDFTGADLRGANFSGANFITVLAEDISGLTQEQLDTAWAWADRPPIGLNGLDVPLEIGYLCDPKLRRPVAEENAPSAGQYPDQCFSIEDRFRFFH